MLQLNGVYIVERIGDLDPSLLKTGDIIHVIEEYDTEKDEESTLTGSSTQILVLTQIFGNTMFRFSGTKYHAYTYGNIEEGDTLAADFDSSVISYMFMLCDGELRFVSEGDKYNPVKFQSYSLNGGRGHLKCLCDSMTEQPPISNVLAMVVNENTETSYSQEYTVCIKLEQGSILAAQSLTTLSKQYSFRSIVSMFLIHNGIYMDLGCDTYRFSNLLPEIFKEHKDTKDFNEHLNLCRSLTRFHNRSLSTLEGREKVLSAIRSIFGVHTVDEDYLSTLVEPLIRLPELDTEIYADIFGGQTSIDTYTNGKYVYDNPQKGTPLYNARRRANSLNTHRSSSYPHFNPYTGEIYESESIKTVYHSSAGAIYKIDGRLNYIYNLDDVYVSTNKQDFKEEVEHIEKQQNFVKQYLS